MKKIVYTIILLLVMLIPFNVHAKNDKKITIYVFYGEGCPHCHAFFEFLDRIEKEYGKYYTLVKKETWNNKSNNNMMNELAKDIENDDFDMKELGVPYIIIGDKTFIGYNSVLNDEIKQTIKEEYDNEEYHDNVIKYIKKYDKAKKNENLIYYSSIIALVLVTCIAVFVKEKIDIKKNA